jgi:hypothetical protein
MGWILDYRLVVGGALTAHRQVHDVVKTPAIGEGVVLVLVELVMVLVDSVFLQAQDGGYRKRRLGRNAGQFGCKIRICVVLQVDFRFRCRLFAAIVRRWCVVAAVGRGVQVEKMGQRVRVEFRRRMNHLIANYGLRSTSITGNEKLKNDQSSGWRTEIRYFRECHTSKRISSCVFFFGWSFNLLISFLA